MLTATLLKSKASQLANKVVNLAKIVVTEQVGPVVKDLVSPTEISILNKETTDIINTAVKIYAFAIAVNPNEHVITRHIAKLSLVAPKGSPLQAIGSLGMSTGWLIANHRGKAFLTRAVVTGVIISGYTIKLQNLNKEPKYALAT